MLRSSRSRTTGAALVGCALAAPLFVVLWAAQALTRDGFRPTFHPMSLLALGDGGWVQVANFVVTGALVAGGGIGLRRVLEPGRLTRWASLLVVLMGVGLVVAGVFPTDAGAGFPVGAPEGAPRTTWHGAVHQVGFVLTQLSFVALVIVLSLRFWQAARRDWAAACAVALVLAVAAPVLGDPETLAIRLVISAGIELGLVSALALASSSGRVR